MKLDFNKQFLDLAGNPAGKTTMGELLSNTLANGVGTEPAKYIQWALTLLDKKPLELNRRDEDDLYDFIRNNNSLSNLAKIRLLEVFERGENKENKG